MGKCTYAKYTCRCGAEVSTAGLSRSSHNRMHVRKGEMTEKKGSFGYTSFDWIKAPKPALFTKQGAEMMASTINVLCHTVDPKPEWVELVANAVRYKYLDKPRWVVEVLRNGDTVAALVDLDRERWPEYLRDIRR